MKKILMLLIFLTFTAKAQNLKVLTFNLHGFHPSFEAPRFFESINGNIAPAPANIFFFTEEELFRGHKKRIDSLASEIRNISPDIIFLQEVTAGYPDQNARCERFYDKAAPEDLKNSALRLEDNLLKDGFTAAVACRGNAGWVTDLNTFRENRIVKYDSSGNKSIVFDYGENPYPKGIVVEGMALLAGKNWQIIENYPVDVKYSIPEKSAFIQLAVLENKNSEKKDRIIAVNIHAGHKTDHFEQAVAIRRYLLEFFREREDIKNIRGFLIAGDFNAHLFRPSKVPELSEISTMPWEIEYPESKSFIKMCSKKIRALKDSLFVLNFNRRYKNFAVIEDTSALMQRIDKAVADFVRFIEEIKKEDVALHIFATQDTKFTGHKFRLVEGNAEPGEERELIDHIFTSKKIKIKSINLLYPENNWDNLNSLSDHPAILGEYEIAD